VEAAKLFNEDLFMVAFTGRAARRMEETSGYPASTIHSFCNKVDGGQIHLEHGEPTIIIDEASMIDLSTMFSICLRMQPGCKLIMVGDPGQLPPIGFGIVFHAFCNDVKIPKVELTEIHRQAAATGIPHVAQNIRRGILPDLSMYKGYGSGVSFLECPFDDITGTLMDVVDSLGGFDKAQILSPLKRGKSGTNAINQLAHEFEAAGKPQYQGFAPGEPVIWLHNDYELGLMNGSLGRVMEINNNLNICWNSEGNIEVSDVGDLDYAYGITVHKSQGSEFPRIVVPVFDSRLLDRTLLYTAVTRAKQQVVLVGDKKAFKKAVMSPGNASRRETAMHIHFEVLFDGINMEIGASVRPQSANSG
jgi:exodeoxyribonuclease V alpha subunit